MFNASYMPEVIRNLIDALHINMYACCDCQKAVVRYKFWREGKKDEYEFDLPFHECICQDPPFDFTAYILTHLTAFLNKIETDRQKEKEIEEYQKLMLCLKKSSFKKKMFR